MKKFAFLTIIVVFGLALKLMAYRFSSEYKLKAYIDSRFPTGDRSDEPALKGRWRKEVHEIEDMVYKQLTEEDVLYLASIVRAGYPVETHLHGEGSEEERANNFGRHQFWQAANICLATRLMANVEIGAPIPQQTREIIKKLWLEELGMEFSERRAEAAASLIEYGYTDTDPQIRKAVDEAIEKLDGFRKEDLIIFRANHEKAKGDQKRLKELEAKRTR